MNAPFRNTVGDPRKCLEDLREADRLLDSVPRTHAAGAADANDDVVLGAMAGGVVGAAIVAAASDRMAAGDATPAAATEYGQAVDLLKSAAKALDQHQAAQGIHDAIRQANAMPVLNAAGYLANYVRMLHPRLREEFGLFDAPALSNWNATDAEDLEAMRAAGVGWRSKIGWAIGIGAVVFVFYAYLFTR